MYILDPQLCTLHSCLICRLLQYVTLLLIMICLYKNKEDCGVGFPREKADSERVSTEHSALSKSLLHNIQPNIEP